jgi:hypothetical protein
MSMSFELEYEKTFRRIVLSGLGLFLLVLFLSILFSQRQGNVISPGSSLSHDSFSLSAARETLARLGITSSSLLKPIATLKGSSHVLIRAYASKRILEKQPALARWVARGNRLILLSNNIKPFTVEKMNEKDTSFPSKFVELVMGITQDPTATPLCDSNFTRARIINCRGGGWPKIAADENALLETENGVIISRKTLGRGQVDTVYDGAMFSNRRLGDNDNSVLFYDLLSQQKHLYFEESSHGYSQYSGFIQFLFLSHARIITFTSLFLFGLWFYWGRPGNRPRFAWHPPERASKNEYIVSLADRLFSHGDHRALLMRMKGHLEKHLAQRSGFFNATSRELLYQRAQALSILSAEEISFIRQLSSIPEDRLFSSLVRIQKIINRQGAYHDHSPPC